MKKLLIGALACCFIFGSFDLTAGNGMQPQTKKRVLRKKRKKMTKSARADLVVSWVRITPDPPRAKKDLITIKVKVKNAGNAPTPMKASLSMSVYSVDASGNRVAGKDQNMGAIPWYTNNIPVLNPNESEEISKTITCNFPGPHEVSGVIITEGFETGNEYHQNNSYKKIFQVHLPPRYADLELTQFQINTAGQLVIKMCNKGASVPTGDFEYSQVRVVVNSDPYKSLLFPEVDPSGIVKKGRGPMPIGPVKYLVYRWPDTGSQALLFTSGQTYTVKVHLNYNNAIYDKNLSNNVKTKTLTAP